MFYIQYNIYFVMLIKNTAEDEVNANINYKTVLY